MFQRPQKNRKNQQRPTAEKFMKKKPKIKKIDFVKKKENAQAVPIARPIEKFWALVKAEYKKRKSPVKKFRIFQKHLEFGGDCKRELKKKWQTFNGEHSDEPSSHRSPVCHSPLQKIIHHHNFF